MMLQLEAISLERSGRRLLDGISLSIVPGRLITILGPNGAGKSSLLKIMSGEWRPSHGRVLLDGTPLQDHASLTLAARRAVVSQSTQLAFPFSVRDLVLLGATVPGFAITSPGPMVRAALAEVGLTGFEDRIYSKLSGGERQRIHIARALVQLWAATGQDDQRKLLLLDEPTASLDPAHQVAVLRMAQSRAGDGWAVVAVLHDLNLAAAWSDTVILMRDGRVLASGAPGDVMTGPQLSAVYGCRMVANRPPEDGKVYVLPHHIRQEPPRHRADRPAS